MKIYPAISIDFTGKQQEHRTRIAKWIDGNKLKNKSKLV